MKIDHSCKLKKLDFGTVIFLCEQFGRPVWRYCSCSSESRRWNVDSFRPAVRTKIRTPVSLSSCSGISFRMSVRLLIQNRSQCRGPTTPKIVQMLLLTFSKIMTSRAVTSAVLMDSRISVHLKFILPFIRYPAIPSFDIVTKSIPNCFYVTSINFPDFTTLLTPTDTTVTWAEIALPLSLKTEGNRREWANSRGVIQSSLMTLDVMINMLYRSRICNFGIVVSFQYHPNHTNTKSIGWQWSMGLEKYRHEPIREFVEDC
jgi:hypothetical protein